MVLINTAPSGFEMHNGDMLKGNGFRDFFKGLFRSFGNVVRPAARTVRDNAVRYAQQKVLPAASNFVTNTVIPQGSRFLSQTLEDVAQGRKGTIRNNFRNAASNVVNQGRQQLQQQGNELLNFGKQQATVGANEAANQFRQQRPAIRRRNVRNLKKGGPSVANKVGQLLDQSFSGNGLNRL